MVHVELITPERMLFAEEVDSVIAPTELGEIGILAHHAPLLAKLAPGELRLRKGDNVRSVAVTGGFIEVQQGSRVEVLAETAEFAEEINVERAAQAAERAKAKLASQDLTAKEMAELEASMMRASIRLKVASIRRRQAGTPK